MNAFELGKAESLYREAKRRANFCRTRRNNAIRAALAAGWTHQQISDATGLSRGRISQIKANPRRP